MRLDLKIKAALCVALLVATTATVSAATSFLVTNLDDAGLGSFRQAILNANAAGGNPTITFSTAPGTLFAEVPQNTITISTGELHVTTALTIQGLGAAKLIISGTHSSRVFNIDPGAGNAVNISGITVSEGLPKAATPFGGAGILVSSGTLNLADSEVTNNDASMSSDPSGGGITNEGATANLVRCTFTGNTATASGGAIQNENGGVTTLVNSTINGNSAGAAGSGGGVSSSANLTLINCTIVGNTAQHGGNTSAPGTINLQNTIISGGLLVGNNSSGADINGAGYNSMDYNLIQDVSGGTITGAVAHNVTGKSPILAALADNGGLTRTMALRIGSPALDAGSAVTDPTTSAPLATDQRGKARVVNNPSVIDAGGGNGSDIGAVELQPAAPTISLLGYGFSFENGSSGAIPVQLDDADTPVDQLTLTAHSLNPDILLDSGIVIGGAGANRTMTFTPAPNQMGWASVTLAVSDGTNETDGFFLLFVVNPPEITSANSTTFTIGQACPDLAVIGDDQTVEVGTPCPFTVTSTGYPLPDIAIGGDPLPEGVYLLDNIDGTATLGGIPAPGTAGKYNITFTATNNLG